MAQQSKLIFTASIAALMGTGFATGSALASDVSESEIVKQLSKKKKPLTRGLTRSLKKPAGAMSTTEKGYLRNLGKTRGIKFVVKEGEKPQDYAKPTYEKQEIEKIVTIVKKHDLPKLDFKIGFEFGSAQVSGPSIIQVVELAKALNHPALKETRIILGGHTDAKGSDAFNQILSQKRSNSVAKMVVEIGGIDPARLVPVGFGEHKLKNPYDPHASENRRVEVINISTY